MRSHIGLVVVLLGSGAAGWFVGCGGGSSAGTVDGAAAGGQGGNGSDVPGGAGGSGAGGGGAGGGGSGDGAGGMGGCGTTQCTDCIDNDGDGKTDYYDGECVGPLDNDESSFATGIPGDNMDPCKQDCFFDGNSGMGDDKCEWQLKCDPANPGKNLGCPYDPGARNCPTTQSEECKTKCGRLTPNGCDCFGCCTFGDKSVLLLPGCTQALINDPKVCPPCTPSTACGNPCERCELCIGKTEIPADCPRGDAGVGPDGGTTDGGTPPPAMCAAGWVSCGPGGIEPSQCPTGTVCVTGCCITVVP